MNYPPVKQRKQSLILQALKIIEEASEFIEAIEEKRTQESIDEFCDIQQSIVTLEDMMKEKHGETRINMAQTFVVLKNQERGYYNESPLQRKSVGG